MQPGGAAAEEESGGAGDEDTEATAGDVSDKTEGSQDGRELARVEFFGVQEAGGWAYRYPLYICPVVHILLVYDGNVLVTRRFGVLMS